MALMQSPDAMQTLERLQAASGGVPSPLDLAKHGLGALNAIEVEMDALRTQSAQAEAAHRKSMAEAEQLLAQALRDLREEAGRRQALEMRPLAWLALQSRRALAAISWRIAHAARRIMGRLGGQKPPIPMGKTETDPHDDRP